jgi:hypothetical protein
MHIYILKCGPGLFFIGLRWPSVQVEFDMPALNDVRKSQIMPDQARKWLRQQSEYFYAGGFDPLVKRWNKCINIGGG